MGCSSGSVTVSGLLQDAHFFGDADDDDDDGGSPRSSVCDSWNRNLVNDAGMWVRGYLLPDALLLSSASDEDALCWSAMPGSILLAGGCIVMIVRVFYSTKLMFLGTGHVPHAPGKYLH